MGRQGDRHLRVRRVEVPAYILTPRKTSRVDTAPLSGRAHVVPSTPGAESSTGQTPLSAGSQPRSVVSPTDQPTARHGLAKLAHRRLPGGTGGVRQVGADAPLRRQFRMEALKGLPDPRALPGKTSLRRTRFHLCTGSGSPPAAMVSR